MKEVTIYNSDSYEVYTEDEVRENIAENLDIPVEEVTQEQVWEEYSFLSDMNFEDESLNLSKILDGRILVLASIGTWHGRVQGYKIIGNNLNEVLTQAQGDYYKVYTDRYNVRATDSHHDGTNTYLFREIREDKYRDIDRLLNKIYNGETISSSLINYYTKSLRPYIKEVYGV